VLKKFAYAEDMVSIAYGNATVQALARMITATRIADSLYRGPASQRSSSLGTP